MRSAPATPRCTIIEEMATFADEVRRRHGLNFSVRIGINSGEVIVGAIGDDLRMDYTAQGNTVGLAARVEALAAPGSAYITDHTAELVRGYLALHDLGEFSLKNVREPMRIWRLDGLGQARTRLDVSRARGLSRFVGRRAEIAQARGGAGESAARRAPGRSASIGEAGAGKSRLCFEFMERSRVARASRTTKPTASPHGNMIPFLPALELLRAYFGLSEHDDARTQREKIAGRVVLLDPAMAKTLPLVFDFMGIADPDAPAAARSIPRCAQRILFEHLKLSLDAVASVHPSVVLWDDLHWIDGGSDGFLAEYIELTAGMPVLVLANSRPGLSRGVDGRAVLHRDHRRPLRDDELDELLGERLGNDASLAGLAERIAAQTGGNPFFIEEVVRALAESGALWGEPGSYVLVNADAEISIPPTVQAVFAARIDKLAEVDKNLLETAAVVGKRFEVDDAAQGERCVATTRSRRASID